MIQIMFIFIVEQALCDRAIFSLSFFLFLCLFFLSFFYITVFHIHNVKLISLQTQFSDKFKEIINVTASLIPGEIPQNSMAMVFVSLITSLCHL